MIAPHIHTFSHYTWVKSEKNLIVVDLQGVGSWLTDPAIHCTNKLRFGRTNLGADGIARYFKHMSAMRSVNDSN